MMMTQSFKYKFCGILLAVLLVCCPAMPALAADAVPAVTRAETAAPVSGISGEPDAVDAPGLSDEPGASDQPDASDQMDAFDEFEGFDEFDDDTETASTNVADPFSGYNRVMTICNDRLYYWVLEPVSSGYAWVVPEPVRQSVNNFFSNLGYPGRFVNNLLQLKMKQSGVETARFVINSTVGVGGLFDPANAWLDLQAYDEDFGQTLGNYGLGGGYHVVWPFFGPCNVRDSFGRIVDWGLSPTTYIKDDAVATGVSVLETVNGTSLKQGQYEALTKDALDLYVLLRDAYEQNRKKNIEE